MSIFRDTPLEHGDLNHAVPHLLGRYVGARQNVAVLPVERRDLRGDGLDLGECQLASLRWSQQGAAAGPREDRHPRDLEAGDQDTGVIAGGCLGLGRDVRREGEKGQQGQNREHQISVTRDPPTSTRCASHPVGRLAHRVDSRGGIRRLRAVNALWDGGVLEGGRQPALSRPAGLREPGPRNREIKMRHAISRVNGRAAGGVKGIVGSVGRPRRSKMCMCGGSGDSA